jgi:arylsulfatase A-like enzyme
MPDTRRPNILFVFGDQHRGQDLGVAGNEQLRTPNIDRLAAEGLYLPHMYSGAPVTCAARGVLMTGKYPHKSGLRINDQRLPVGQKTLGTELSAAGYTTAFVGKWHLDGGIREPGFVPKERRHGFQWWAANQCRHDYFNTWYFRDTPEPIRMDQYEPITLTDVAIEFLRGHADQPFCLVVGYSPPHDPYVAPPEYMAQYLPEDIKLRPNFVPGTVVGGRNPHEIGPEHPAGYYAAITCIDDQVGRLMATLAELGIADDTLFIFTSDHGDMLGSNGYILKRKPHEESIKVPGIFRWPTAIRPGQTKDALFAWVDLMPTLLSLGGASLPGDAQGHDLSQALLDPAADGPEQSVYLTQYMPYPTKVDAGWRGVRTKRYTYARYEDRVWVTYDNREDPYQLRNLAEDPGAAGLRDELEGLMLDWMKKTEDSWDYNVPKTTVLHLSPVEEHEALIAAAYRESGRRLP